MLSTIDGEDLRRSYSICSGVDEDKLEVAIKAVEGGQFSTFANASLQAGDTLEVMPPESNFYTELSSDNDKNYLCIATLRSRLTSPYSKLSG